MDIRIIRSRVGKSQFSITDHALLESFKDGISFGEVIWALNHGEIIEDYPERNRCLVYAKLPSGIFLHVVVDYLPQMEIEIVTVYVPHSKRWIKGRKRKR